MTLPSRTEKSTNPQNVTKTFCWFHDLHLWTLKGFMDLTEFKKLYKWKHIHFNEMEITSCTNFDKCFSLLHLMIFIYWYKLKLKIQKIIIPGNTHAYCFWIKILTNSQWCFLTCVFPMPKLIEKFSLLKKKISEMMSIS